MQLEHHSDTFCAAAVGDKNWFSVFEKTFHRHIEIFSYTTEKINWNRNWQWGDIIVMSMKKKCERGLTSSLWAPSHPELLVGPSYCPEPKPEDTQKELPSECNCQSQRSPWKPDGFSETDMFSCIWKVWFQSINTVNRLFLRSSKRTEEGTKAQKNLFHTFF